MTAWDKSLFINSNDIMLVCVLQSRQETLWRDFSRWWLSFKKYISRSMRTLIKNLQQSEVQESQIYEQSVLKQKFTNEFNFRENHSCINYNTLLTHVTLSLVLMCRSFICVHYIWIECETQNMSCKLTLHGVLRSLKYHEH